MSVTVSSVLLKCIPNKYLDFHYGVIPFDDVTLGGPHSPHTSLVSDATDVKHLIQANKPTEETLGRERYRDKSDTQRQRENDEQGMVQKHMTAADYILALIRLQITSDDRRSLYTSLNKPL